jgi:hypothetical protein
MYSSGLDYPMPVAYKPIPVPPPPTKVNPKSTILSQPSSGQPINLNEIFNCVGPPQRTMVRKITPKEQEEILQFIRRKSNIVPQILIREIIPVYQKLKSCLPKDLALRDEELLQGLEAKLAIISVAH